MIIPNRLSVFIATIFLLGCSQVDSFKNAARQQELSEKTGIEMVVIQEAEKVTNTAATRFLRNLMLADYAGDPLQSPVRQESLRGRTVELPGVSFLVDYDAIEWMVDTINSRLAYRRCMAFISNEDTRADEKQTFSIIQTDNKFNALRLQETRGGSYIFATDSLIQKLQVFEKKYPFRFIGVGEDWLLIQTNETPADWSDFMAEVLKVCPLDGEMEYADYLRLLEQSKGRVSMWWD